MANILAHSKTRNKKVALDSKDRQRVKRYEMTKAKSGGGKRLIKSKRLFGPAKYVN